MTVRAVLFDLDGTLVDSMGIVADAMVEAFAPFDIVTTREELLPLIGAPVLTFLVDQYGLTPEQATPIAEHYLDIYHSAYIAKTPPHPGADALVRGLHARGMMLAVVTNKNSRGARAILDLEGWRDFFQVVSSRETAPPKPDPEAALSVLRTLDVPAAEAAIVGDTEFDMNCGRDAGLAFVIGLVGERTAERLRAEGATHVVRHLSEVAGIVEATR